MTTHTIYTFLLPLTDNEGNYVTDAQADFRNAAMAVAGGWTQRPTELGAWKDDRGKEYLDEISPLDVACYTSQVHGLMVRFFELFPDQLALAIRANGKLNLASREATLAGGA